MIRLILNPKAGNKAASVNFRITRWIERNAPETEICYTREKGHGEQLAREAFEKKYTRVIAVGGDGTVNEIARALTSTGIELGIIPAGSGNGIARHFRIPLQTEKALEVAFQGKPLLIDTCTLNDIPFFMLAGTGFDAHVAGLFSLSKSRGLSTYAKLSATEYLRFRENQFTITVNDEVIKRNAFVVVVANCTQFGNNATIAPDASPTDGLMNVSILKKAPLHQVVPLAWRLFTGHIANSRYIETFTGSRVRIEQDRPDCQVDGEYLECGNILDIRVHPLTLKLIIP